MHSSTSNETMSFPPPSAPPEPPPPPPFTPHPFRPTPPVPTGNTSSVNVGNQKSDVTTLKFPSTHSPGPWSTGLCGCCEDVSSCCLTCWCPCVAFGRIAEIVDRGSTWWHGNVERQKRGVAASEPPTVQNSMNRWE
ncbi:hypothetical protein Vadar_020596 [Vaccinium darrowii]|uniref:Uncharacterized protein n=1 Tax=Vaccinium darrowii TaxID=229202 RepID=A0ACB7X292_9ERIC|nr:hypothetical protein Vadar_020596 [Vaccinium darrowii]